MDELFDLRLTPDVRRLSAHLPVIDGTSFHVDREKFESLIRSLSDWIGAPEWLKYQFGSVVLKQGDRPYGPVSLATLLDLANRLSGLSACRGFDELLQGFRSARQFHDTIFETRVAEMLRSLPGAKDLEFSPRYQVRGTTKRPDFHLFIKGKRFVVEAKVPKLHEQRAGQKFDREVAAFREALAATDWPAHLRLEVCIHAPAKQRVSDRAQRLVARARSAGEGTFEDAGVTVHVVSMDAPFATDAVGFVAEVLTPVVATGLFNPKLTTLRVVNDRLEGQVATSVGQTLSDALSQLPPEEQCMIVVGGVPRRIMETAVRPRLADRSYAHVVLIASWRETPLELYFRESDRKNIGRLFPGAV